MKRFVPIACVLLGTACAARGNTVETELDGSTDDVTMPADMVVADVPPLPDVPKATDVPPVDVPAVDVPELDVQPVDVPAVDVPSVDVPPADVVSDAPPRPCLRDTDCTSGNFCSDTTARCTPRVCVPDSSSCISATRIRYCDTRGSVNTEIDCPGGANCTAGRCDAPMGCTAGVASCASATTRRVCNPDGTTFTNTPCPAGTNGTGACSGAGVCGFTCTAGFGDCDATAANGCEATLGTDSRNCGACANACSAGQSCVAGACVAAPTPTGTPFQVNALLTTGCRVIDHNTTTGDDRGGIAVSASSLFYSGDVSTSRFDPETLANTALGRIVDGLVSNLHDGTVYTLANGTTPLASTGGTISALIELDGATGAQTTRSVTLSTPITLATTTDVGIFSGYDRIVILGNGRAYNIDLPSGRVIDMGSMTFGTHQSCESWAVWGVAEFYGGALYVDYVQSSTVVARARIPDGAVTTLATFTNLSDMCSFTVSPARSRWYFHHEGSSQFGGTAETAGYCGATLSVSGSTSCPTGLTMCSSGCADLTSDSANCGACGRACTGTMTCTASACATSTSLPHYTRETPPAGVTFTDVCATGTRVLVSFDDSNVSVPLPFAWQFWGMPLASGRTVNVATNGFLNLDGTSTASLSGTIPSTTTPNGVIALFWRDLMTSASGVCHATLGTAPARRFVVEWSATSIYSGTGAFSGEIVLNEADNTIDLLYGTSTVPSTTVGTIGVENLTGTESVSGCTPTTTTSCTITASSGVRFRPAP